MFGDPPPTDGKLARWLECLKEADPVGQLGALVHRNLLTDANVCEEHRQKLRDAVEAQPDVTQPEEAEHTYQWVLDEMQKSEPVYRSMPNERNRLPTVPFAKLGRVTSIESFLKYNVFRSPKHVPRFRYRAGAGGKAAGQKIAVSEYDRTKPAPDDLVGKIGPDPVFVTSAQTLSENADNPDSLRNSLGLADEDRYGIGESFVGIWYDHSRVPHEDCFRPTVLDTGWSPASGAFLPNVSDDLGPGRTQNLETGTPCAPEVIHAPFPANQIDAHERFGPLGTNPPEDFKPVRLEAHA